MIQSCFKTIKCAIWKDNLTGEIVQTIFDHSWPKHWVESRYNSTETIRTSSLGSATVYSRKLLYTFSIKQK